MKLRFLLIFSCFLSLSSNLFSYAGGPLEVRQKRPLSYKKRAVVFKFDRGPLGKLSNEEAVQLVEELFSVWESVETASIRFKKTGFLKKNIDKTNFKPVLKPKTESDLNGFTPIVFDEDGTLLDALFGEGGGNAALGIGAPVILKKGNRFSIPESQIVLNGKFINGVDTPEDREVSIDRLKRTILHEIGHAIGLDHSQINIEAIAPGATQEIKDTVPVMFPRATSDLLILRQDDVSVLSFLYPDKEKLKEFGTIRGKLFRSDGKTPVQGANVILRNLDNPEINAISCVSDFLKRKKGDFLFFAVPPGKYTIEIEPIDPEFAGAQGGPIGPSVGPFAKSSEGKSFQNPVGKGFYQGPGLPVTTAKEDALIIEINAGEVIKNLNIISAE